jgi:hypothetical protein
MRDLHLLRSYQVFLNYPFDAGFRDMALAMHFAVVAANMVPVCAKDLSVPDLVRVDMLVRALANCQYSAHDLSRGKGEGDDNYARLNMSIEFGMALFHDKYTDGAAHRCAFFVASPDEYREYASNLSGLDPLYHETSDSMLVKLVYDWLGSIVPDMKAAQPPTAEVIMKYGTFKEELKSINGTGRDGQPSHDEAQEFMYQLCGAAGWWIWRENPLGLKQFPKLPLSFKT